MSLASLKMEISGINQAVQKLVDAATVTEAAAAKGLLAAGLIIQRRAMDKTPVEYGNLRASAFARRRPGVLTVEVGFTAAYAKYVHELTGEKLRGKPRPSGLGTYWNPGESEFLLKAVNETRVGEIVSLIDRYMKADLRTLQQRGGGAA